MPVKLTKKSLANLAGVHPHLVAVIKRAAEISDLKFQVTEGARTLARQKQLKAAGASRTLNSRHIPAPNGLAHAVDLVVMIGSRISWEFSLYARLAGIVREAARQLGTPVDWGGDWKSLRDGPHFELPWKQYPGIASVDDIPPPPPANDDLATLVIGAAGAAVMDLQRALNAAGAQLIADGDFGPRTDAALRQFQKSRGLKVDGIAGPKTLRALNLLPDLAA